MPAFIDLTGQRFGRLSIVKRDKNRLRRVYWLCKCDCGNESSHCASDLRGGRIQSCGCSKNEFISKSLTIDLTGQRFGKLQVLSRAPNRGLRAYWNCKCDCGARKRIASSSLREKRSNSCGCGVVNAARARRTRPIVDLHLYQIASSVRSSEHARNKGCDLTTKQIVEILRQPCFYCQSRKHRRGLDRVDSTKGYLLANVVPACTMCNYAKSNRALEEFLDWLEHLSTLQSPRQRILGLLKQRESTSLLS